MIALAIQHNGVIFQHVKAQPSGDRCVGTYIPNRQVNTAKSGPELHVGPLQIQPNCCLYVTRRVSVINAQPAPAKQGNGIPGHGVLFEMGIPLVSDRIVQQPGRLELVRAELAVETYNATITIPDR